jgi:hypothetical protein
MTQFKIKTCYRVFLQNPKTNTDGKPLVHSYYGLFKGDQKIPYDSIHGELQQAYYFKLPKGVGVLNLSQKQSEQLDNTDIPIYTGSDNNNFVKRMTYAQGNEFLVQFFKLTLSVIRESTLNDDEAKILAPDDTKVIAEFNDEKDANLMWQKMLHSASSIPLCMIKLQSKYNPQNCNSVLRTIADDCKIDLEKIRFKSVDQWGIQTNLKAIALVK